MLLGYIFLTAIFQEGVKFLSMNGRIYKISFHWLMAMGPTMPE
jgi:hypothetical protein